MVKRSACLGWIFAAGLAPAIVACGGGGELVFPTGGNGGGGEGQTGDIGGSYTGASGGAGGASGGAGGAGGAGASGGTGGASGVCGDGVASPDEPCDGDDFHGASCKDHGFTAAAGLTCTGSCLVDTSGCTATCDGALLEPGEDCDGVALGGHDCTEMGYAEPTGVACIDCLLDYGMCAASCGNQIAETGELCDGPSVGMASCADFGYVDPAGLACNETCTNLDSSGCKASCNGTFEPGETCDGANLNGFDCTQIGYTNPAGAACVACQIDTSGCQATCGNGDVEPGEDCDDGNVANNDGCSATCLLGGASCADAIPVALALGTQTLTGTTAGGGASSGTCASAGPGRIYAVTPAAAGFLTASLLRATTTYQSVLFARTDCNNAGTQLLCADSKDPNGAVQLFGGEVISFPVSANQVIYVFVDGEAAGDAGAYGLELDLSEGSTCNDPVPIRIEKGTPMRLLGFTNGQTPSGGGSCGGGFPGIGPSDVVYNVNFAGGGAPVSAALDASATNYNSVLYARYECNDGMTQLMCDNAAGNGGESITFNPNNDPSTFVWVDGVAGLVSQEGYYALVLTPAP
jgi:cysteine-rich repeat protein